MAETFCCDFQYLIAFWDLTSKKIGRGDVQVVEPPDAVKCVLVRWNGVKIDLTKLAKLRWIEKLSTEKICGLVGKRRSAIRTSIRTIRKCGLSELNLTILEKKIILEQMKLENRIYAKSRAKWHQ